VIDQILGNRYKIARQIGAGGMAWVYLAEDLREKRQVAVKVLYPQFAEDSTYTQRFHREAKIALNLVDDHLVSVLDYGADRDTQYLVMEYVEGENLDDYLLARGPLPWEEALEIALQVSHALEVAYNLNIVHRDIKPQNLIRSPDGTIRVLDFGLARALDLPSLTQSGFLGSPSHISPEQATGKRADIRSDIYSLGVVLYQMLAGSPPFEAENVWSVIGQHIASPLPPLRDRVPDVPAEVEAAVNCMLEKDPDERYQTPAELSIHLRKLLKAKPVASRTRKRSKKKPAKQKVTAPIAPAYPSRYEESVDGNDDWLSHLKESEESPAATTQQEEIEILAAAEPTGEKTVRSPVTTWKRDTTWKWVGGIVAILILGVILVVGFPAVRTTRSLNQAYGHAIQSIDDRNWPAALSELNQIIENSPNFRDAQSLRDRIEAGQLAYQQFERGMAHYRDERWGDAIAIWKPLLDREEDWGQDELIAPLCNAYRRLTGELQQSSPTENLPEQLEHWEHIAELYAEAVEICPDDAALKKDQELAGLYIDSLQAREREDWDAAIDRLNRMLKLRPAYLQTPVSEQLYLLLMERGHSRLHAGDPIGAEEDFLEAINLPVADRSAARVALDELPPGERRRFKHPEPALLAPANEEIIGGGDGAAIMLEWEHVPELAEDEFYNVTVMHFVNGKPAYWGDGVREPHKLLDKPLADPVGLGEADRGEFHWWVVVKKDVTNDEERLDGPSISPESEHRIFIWQ